MHVADHSTKCCKQPLHDECLSQWIVQRRINIQKKELTCPYCRQVMTDLPLHANDNWKKDLYFADRLKMAWGERPFWRANEVYWGKLKIDFDTKEILCFLGHEKHLDG